MVLITVKDYSTHNSPAPKNTLRITVVTLRYIEGWTGCVFFAGVGDLGSPVPISDLRSHKFWNGTFESCHQLQPQPHPPHLPCAKKHDQKTTKNTPACVWKNVAGWQMSSDQNPYDIPLYWLVKNGILVLAYEIIPTSLCRKFHPPMFFHPTQPGGCWTDFYCYLLLNRLRR